MKKGFFQVGHWPTLLAAFLYFDLSFMVWVILGPLGVQIARELGLSPAQKGLMVAIPVLAGALLMLFAARSGVVTTLLAGGAVGVVLALAGVTT